MRDLWVVRYAFESPPYRAFRPLVYRVVEFSGGSVWGVNVATDQLVVVNGPLDDGSGRSYGLKVYASSQDAERAAAGLGSQIGAAVEARLAERAAADAERDAKKEEYIKALKG